MSRWIVLTALLVVNYRVALADTAGALELELDGAITEASTADRTEPFLQIAARRTTAPFSSLRCRATDTRVAP